MMHRSLLGSQTPEEVLKQSVLAKIEGLRGTTRDWEFPSRALGLNKSKQTKHLVKWPVL